MEEYYLDIHTSSCKYRHNANECCLFDYSFSLFIENTFYLVKTNKCILGMEYGCRVREPTDVAEKIINIMHGKMGVKHTTRRMRICKQRSFKECRINNYDVPDFVYQLNYIYGCGQYGIFTETPFLEAAFLQKNNNLEIICSNAEQYRKKNCIFDYNGTSIDVEGILKHNKYEPISEKEMILGIPYLIKEINKEIKNQTIHRF